ncbi:MAG: hypothetical protein C0402_06385 [Thermodesulfovibrio sp.]|nr:hypothetical protein [Thermodesulfovibrio sp.]
MAGNNFEFLILGAGRGGTSLLAGLLDYHSRLTVAFEMFSVAYLMGKELNAQQTSIFDERVRAFIAACEIEAGRNPDVKWGNKITSEQLFGLEDHNRENPQATIDIPDQFFNSYLGDKKVIFILRDGRTCVNSKVQRTGMTYQTACERWLYSVSIYRFFKTRHFNNICIRFEDLLIHPQTTLVDICSFLEIPFEDKMLQGVNNLLIPPEYRQDRLDVSKTESVSLPEEYRMIIKSDLEYCGYI